jgi:hypothetical protein
MCALPANPCDPDTVVITFGTGDLEVCFNKPASEGATGMGRLINDLKTLVGRRRAGLPWLTIPKRKTAATQRRLRPSFLYSYCARRAAWHGSNCELIRNAEGKTSNHDTRL